MRSVRISLVGIALCLAFAGGVCVGRSFERNPSKFSEALSENGTSYKFINPLLFCQDENIDQGGANDLQDAVASYISSEKKNGDLIDASFYFRDLNGGPWALVNPSYKTLPASLLKVPLAISVYQHAEKNQTFLSTKVAFGGGANTNQSEHFPPPEKIMASTTYSVSDLIRYMLVYSDNSAMYLLGNMLDPEELEESYTHLGIEAPTTAGYSIDAKTYGSFFRILYGGTYLSRDDSEHILSLLSQSTFVQGIVAGLPAGTVVAHKFGESDPGDGTVRLNDCGIIYKPNQPYLLCVMTEGTDFDTLAKVIATISKTTYQTLDD